MTRMCIAPANTLRALGGVYAEDNHAAPIDPSRRRKAWRRATSRAAADRASEPFWELGATEAKTATVILALLRKRRSAPKAMMASLDYDIE